MELILADRPRWNLTSRTVQLWEDEFRTVPLANLEAACRNFLRRKSGSPTIQAIRAELEAGVVRPALARETREASVREIQRRAPWFAADDEIPVALRRMDLWRRLHGWERSAWSEPDSTGRCRVLSMEERYARVPCVGGCGECAEARTAALAVALPARSHPSLASETTEREVLA
jgi:hypothetical protein